MGPVILTLGIIGAVATVGYVTEKVKLLQDKKNSGSKNTANKCKATIDGQEIEAEWCDN